jgi:hypothetical protein
MTDLYNSLRTVLKSYNIVTSETQDEQQRISKMVDSMIKVQNELVKQNKNSQMDTLLTKMTREIKENIGATINQDTEELLSQF